MAVEAVRAVRSAPFRSLLTVLAVSAASAALVCLNAYGEASTEKVRRQLEQLGADFILVRSAAVNVDGLSLGVGSRHELRSEDAAALRRDRRIANASAVLAATGNVVYRNRAWHGELLGVEHAYFGMSGITSAWGREPEAVEFEPPNPLAWIGAAVAAQLQLQPEDLPALVHVNGVPISIAGLLPPRGQRGDRNLDNSFIMPLSTLRLRIAKVRAERPDYAAAVIVRAPSISDLPEAREAIVQHFAVGAGRDIDISDAKSLAETAQTISHFYLHFFNLISVAVLAVSSTCAFAIFLLTVAERRREIGIRIAIGAHGWEVILQLAIESAVLFAVGVSIGVALAMQVLQTVGTQLNMPIRFDPAATAIGCAAAMVVVIAISVIPAVRAVRIPPMDALRS